MKKIFTCLLSILVIAAVIVPCPATVLAATDNPPPLTARNALTVKAPPQADINQPVTITVYSKHGHNPVAGAAVYALKIGQIPPSKPGKSDYAAIAADYLASAKASGISLGTTDASGTLLYKFTEANRYLLIASMDGYVPGFSRISINAATRKPLDLRAPGKTEVNTAVTLAVREMFGNPVPAASIYARKIAVAGNVTAQFRTPVLKANIADHEGALKRAAEIKEKGFLLGTTDDKGQLAYTFKETGVYELAAIKDNYIPGFARINVTIAGQKRLEIKAPESSPAGQPVTITIFSRPGEQVIEGASVYAVKIGLIPMPVPLPFRDDRGPFKAEPSNGGEAEKYITAAKQSGILLGTTGKSGTVTYTFNDAGQHALVAIKDGFLPGFDRINIHAAPRKALHIEMPAEAFIGQTIPIIVREKFAPARVAGAALYALRIEAFQGTPGDIFRADPPEADSTAREKFATAIKEKGIQIGVTDDSGIYIHKFADSGHYIVAAIKDGYSPTFDRINIRAMPAQPGNKNK